ncbi:hypothetical protein CAPTEDRAFT_229009 [Capitella teleta]|uniref:Polypeptide N-acetylgalactosaminyltransferase n=1 Tax=Capitella teleta TaxID=283909 RepID=R7UHT6_CAPTE|nr:hypothetical protein CAPTEDRAFT_229009 [Capitella teleta]|eukprot:ELU05643.1 hypothetical protein CAPTEDRAFT_229009 [Capitella teleta]
MALSWRQLVTSALPVLARSRTIPVPYDRENRRNIVETTPTMLRSKLRGGAFTDFMLIAVLVILVYVFITRRGIGAPSDNEVIMNRAAPQERHKSPISTTSDSESQHMIDSRIKMLPDFRSSQCRSAVRKQTTPVSIVIDFYDYQFYDLKTTISAILHNTPPELIAEMLLINDGSSLIYIEEEAERYVKELEGGRLLKNDEQMGSPKARMKAFREAKSSIVVFIDHSVIVNDGWLEPLIAGLMDKPKSIMVPHYDHVHDPVSYELKSTSDNLVSTFSWRMITRMTESKLGMSEQYYKSPVLRGNIFAVTQQYFKAIGGYEENLSEFGGENLELSVRSWLCGGPIYVNPCSRVGILNLKDPVKIQSHKNLRLITEVWFASYKDIAYRTSNVDSSVSSAEKVIIETMKKKLERSTCKTIDWYINDIVKDIASPSEKAKFFGLLRCKTGRCGKVGKDGRVELGQCSPDKYGAHSSDMLFEYDSDRKVKVNGKCLSTKSTAYIQAEECVDKDVHQMYDYTDKLYFKNVWSGYCWMHVTDPDKSTGGKRQIAMAQDCETDTSDGQFISFEFIPL